jgi:hypothetical protein
MEPRLERGFMNKTITDGIVFTPAKFAFGLHHWSSQDGRPGQDDYDNEPNAAFVPPDQDFSGCLELTKTQTVQKLRAFYQTPLSPRLLSSHSHASEIAIRRVSHASPVGLVMPEMCIW